MQKYYRIADLVVKMDSFGRTETQAASYLINEESEYDILIESKRSSLKMMYPDMDDDVCEYISTSHSFYSQLIMHDGMMLHSSAVAVDGWAYLFTAPSGTGKSTHTKLWLDMLGERAFILNDDKPALRFFDGKLYAYGTPWSGKTDLNVNKRIPVRAICILKRGVNNKIERISGVNAVGGVLSQTVRPKTHDTMEKMLETIDRVLDSVDVWQMECNISADAAKMAYDAMKALPYKQNERENQTL